MRNLGDKNLIRRWREDKAAVIIPSLHRPDAQEYSKPLSLAPARLYRQLGKSAVQLCALAFPKNGLEELCRPVSTSASYWAARNQTCCEVKTRCCEPPAHKIKLFSETV